MNTDSSEEHDVDTIRVMIRDYIVENILFGNGQMLEDDMSFQDGGVLDSTGMLEIITFVEERFGIEIDDSEVVPENLGTLQQISRFVGRKMGIEGVTQAED